MVPEPVSPLSPGTIESIPNFIDVIFMKDKNKRNQSQQNNPLSTYDPKSSTTSYMRDIEIVPEAKPKAEEDADEHINLIN